MTLTMFKTTVHGRRRGTGRGGRSGGGGWGDFIARLIPDNVDVVQCNANITIATDGL